MYSPFDVRNGHKYASKAVVLEQNTYQKEGHRLSSSYVSLCLDLLFLLITLKFNYCLGVFVKIDFN